ncbi:MULTISPECIES: Ig-like domain-containing protein, partial [unclassified Campylobacter]|uniref:Ig-like domain-containing protein n=1 Tax=unclassified Campylobacter TaxID=2593542 RepID=UPI003D3525E3
APEVISIDDKDPKSPTNDTTPDIKVKVEKDTTPELVKDNGEIIPSDKKDNGDGTWTLTPKNPIENPTDVNVITTDKAGNPSKPTPVDPVIDTTPPT